MAQDISSLDFDDIKNNLKNYLKTKPEFTDYNFEGSALNSLLDVLAYNTHYLGMYANVVVQESFLDSAQKRSSVVSRAKELGYTPRSAVSAAAKVTITLKDVPLGTPAFSLNRNSITLSASNGTSDLTFNVVETQRVIIEGTDYVFKDVLVKEGTFVTNNYIVTTGVNGNARRNFVIPNKNVDTTTLKVYVKKDELTSTRDEFVRANNTVDFDSQSRVYFLQENFDGFFEVYFGDGSIGKELEDRNVVQLEYVVSNLDAGNGCSKFVLNGRVNNFLAKSVTTIEASSGGKDKENIEDIKFYAPKAFTQQNRAVTPSDYESYIREVLPNVSSIAVWGGEDNIPPIFGKVFIALKAEPGIVFAESTKQSLVNKLITQRAVVTVQPEFKEPDEFYLAINTFVKQNRQQASIDEIGLSAKISDGIKSYFNTIIEKFGVRLYYSSLVKFIDNLDQSIISNLTSFIISKRFVPDLNLQKAYFSEFENPIEPNSIISTGFSTFVSNVKYNVKIRDNPKVTTTKENFFTGAIETFSRLELYNADSSEQEFLADIGTVNYDRGIIDFSVNIVELPQLQTNLIVYAKPQSNDLITRRNKIILLDDNLANNLSGQIFGLNVQVATQ